MTGGAKLLPDPDVAARFIEVLWGDPLPDDVLIWTVERTSRQSKTKKLSYWLKNCQGLERIVKAYTHERNIYAGVGLPGADTPRTSHNRCKSTDIAGLCGLYTDIDFADPAAPDAHRKNNLPPNVGAALELLRAMPVPPTIVVHSGHGLQPYWLFTGPWIFSGESERQRAQQLSQSWNAHLVRLAKDRGWQMDSVYDLARVLRLPGTFNLKPNCPAVPVRVLEWDGPRYSPDELADVIPMPPTPPSVTPRGDQSQSPMLDFDGSWLTESAEPPADKFGQAYQRSKKFADSWDKKRTDLADGSGSGYDFSLATMTVAFGWSDPEIVALLIAHHRKHGTDLKLDRPKYYAHTLTKVRAERVDADRHDESTPSNPHLSFREIQDEIGKYHVGPGEVRHSFARPIQNQGPSQKGVVAPTVIGNHPTYPRSDKSRTQENRSSLWAEAQGLFPLPSNAKPRVKGYLLWSDRDNKGIAVDLFSNTWRNPANAQFKRQKLYFNILPRINGPQIYRRLVPIDDWDDKLHGRISKQIQRAIKKGRGEGWIWFDNALERGYILYLTGAPGLAAFEPINDVRPILIDALKSIHPPGRDEEEGRFHPYGGSQSWVGKAEDTGEEDAGRWEIIAVARGPTDFVGVVAKCVLTGVATEYQQPYWRGQPYLGLEMRHATREAMVEFAQTFPEEYTLTKAAQALQQQVAT